jgi:phage terminase large subunit-like protein
MTGLTEGQLQARKRLFEDFAYYARHCIKIRTKQGKIAPLVLNRVQERFAARIIAQLQRTGRVRMVVLKARQQGLSTVISALQYWWLSQRKAQKGLVMAHEAESTTTLFDMYRRIHDNVPTSSALRPSIPRAPSWSSTSSTADFVLRLLAAAALLAVKRSPLRTSPRSRSGPRIREHQLQRPRAGHP